MIPPSVSLSLPVTWVSCAEMAELIDILLRVATLGGSPRPHLITDDGLE